MYVAVSVKVLLWYMSAKSVVTERAQRIGRDERGELGSWMILAAGLAVAAVAAVALLGPWFNQKTTAITSN